MEDIIKKCNLIINLLKFTFNEKKCDEFKWSPNLASLKKQTNWVIFYLWK